MVRNEKVKLQLITSKSTGLQRNIYFENLYFNELKDLEDVNRFLDIHELPNQTKKI